MGLPQTIKNKPNETSSSPSLTVIAKKDDVYSFSQERKDKYHFRLNGTQVLYFGADIEIMKTILDSLKIEYKLQIVSEDEIKPMLSSGEADIALGVEKTDLIKNVADFPKTPLRSKYYFFYGRSQEAKSTIMTYKNALAHNYTVGILVGYLYPQSFWEAFPYENLVLNSHIVEERDYEDHIKKLKQKKIDLFVGDKDLVRMAIQKLEASGDVYQYKNILYWKDFYSAFSKKSKFKNLDTAKEQIKKSLYNMQERGQLKEINDFWVEQKK
ncbi:MAG: transporter substrate-binding domain-containing protein [Bdellovibrionota bacterium]